MMARLYIIGGLFALLQIVVIVYFLPVVYRRLRVPAPSRGPQGRLVTYEGPLLSDEHVEWAVDKWLGGVEGYLKNEELDSRDAEFCVVSNRYCPLVFEHPRFADCMQALLARGAMITYLCNSRTLSRQELETRTIQLLRDSALRERIRLGALRHEPEPHYRLFKHNTDVDLLVSEPAHESPLPTDVFLPPFDERQVQAYADHWERLVQDLESSEPFDITLTGGLDEAVQDIQREASDRFRCEPRRKVVNVKPGILAAMLG